MSAQSHSRPRRNASPRAGPQPIRATLPFTLRNGSPTRNNNGRRSSPGPASSPTQVWTPSTESLNKQPTKNRASPERSPSSPGFKVEKPKAVRASPAPAIRRTNSLDTIAGHYLTSTWPRTEQYTSFTGLYGPNQRHQSTQTDDVERKGSHKRSSSWGSADNLKEIQKYKQQLRKQGSRQSSSTSQRASPVHGNHSTVANLPSPVSSSSSVSTTTTSTSTSTSKITTPPPSSSSSSASSLTSPVTPSSSSSFQQISVSTSLIGHAHTLPRSTAIPVPNNMLRAPPVPRIRGSVEGLNQEVEKLVLNRRDEEEQPTMQRDGHRAPIPGMANMQTQTPAETQETSDGSDQGSRNHSVSPTFVMDNSRPSSRSSSTGNGDSGKVEKGENSPEYHFSNAKYSSSPSHNKSWQLTRDPPDGCERPQKTKDELGILEEYSTDMSYCPTEQIVKTFKLKQSAGSAFCPILPNLPPTREFTKLPSATTVTSNTAQTQTTPILPNEAAENGGIPETNGHISNGHVSNGHVTNGHAE